MSGNGPNENGDIQVMGPLNVDPKIVDLNLYSEAMMRCVTSFHQLLSVYYAPDADEEIKAKIGKLIDIFLSRTEFEFAPLLKEAKSAVKH